MPKPQKAKYAAVMIAVASSVFMSLISLKAYQYMAELESRIETIEYVLTVILSG